MQKIKDDRFVHKRKQNVKNCQKKRKGGFLEERLIVFIFSCCRGSKFLKKSEVYDKMMILQTELDIMVTTYLGCCASAS